MNNPASPVPVPSSAPVPSEGFSFFAVAVPLWGVLLGAAVLACGCLLAFLLLRRKLPKASCPSFPGKGEQVRVGKLHQQGAREGQQDCFGVSDESLVPTHGLLAVVADGMGGLSGGERISQLVVQAVLDAFLSAWKEENPQRLLLVLAQQAVEEVNRYLGPEGLRESGSTLVMALLRQGSLTFLSVGDSRVSLYRRGALTQLNREHIYRRELALRGVNGEMPLEEAYTSSQGAGLTSFLGMGPLAHIDFPDAPLSLLPGDKLVLMSDGVYNALTDQELALAMEQPPEDAAQAIGRAIEEKNYQNQDNYTAVILGCEGPPPAQKQPKEGKHR